jgi:hypothetical protein
MQLVECSKLGSKILTNPAKLNRHAAIVPLRSSDGAERTKRGFQTLFQDGFKDCQETQHVAQLGPRSMHLYQLDF